MEHWQVWFYSNNFKKTWSQFCHQWDPYFEFAANTAENAFIDCPFNRERMALDCFAWDQRECTQPPQDNHCQLNCDYGHPHIVARVQHCGLIGFQRSNYIATLQYSAKEGSGLNFLTLLQWLFAKNWREIESLVPLADKFGMDIDTTYGFPEKEALSNMLFARLGTGEMCG